MTRMIKPVFALLLVGAVVAPMGCAAPTNPSEARQQAQQVGDARQRVVDQIAEWDAELATLPLDDPRRETIKEQRQVARDHLAEMDKFRAQRLKDADAEELEGANRDKFVDAVRTLPYGEWAVAAGAVAYGLWKKIQSDRNRKRAEQLVHGVDAVLPNKTEKQKLILSATQDADTQKFVAVTRAANPVPVVADTRPVNLGAGGGEAAVVTVEGGKPSPEVIVTPEQ